MKKYKHKNIDESFENIFDSSLVDYSGDMEQQDDQYKRNQIKDWLTNYVMNNPLLNSDIPKPAKRYRISDNYEIPYIIGYIQFKLYNKVHGSGLTELGEIPDYMNIKRISNDLYINNWNISSEAPLLTSFKNFPKEVGKRLIFQTEEDIKSLKGIPTINLNISNVDGYSYRGGEINLNNSVKSIGTPSTNAKNIFKEILLYCDFIKGPNYGQDEIKIQYGAACTFPDDKYMWYGFLRKLPHSGKKYFVVDKIVRNYVWGTTNTTLTHFILDDNGELIEDKDW